MRSFRPVAVALTLLLLAKTVAAAQEGDGELRGSVLSATTGETVAGAWIGPENEAWGTFSWNDGHFFLPEVPSGPQSYEVKALGYQPRMVTLDPAGDLEVELTPDTELQEGLATIMDQLERRRNRGGDLRVFDREALAFNAYFSVGDFLLHHGVDHVRSLCLDEHPEAYGILEREGHQFYLVETFGGMVRLYTEDFVEQAAKDRLVLQTEPYICSGPVGKQPTT
jgi:Carboxypeptidase regulatory-like domain